MTGVRIESAKACPEWYADNSKATPRRGARDCSRKHRQYVCATCGRMICADVRGIRRARCFMPFGSSDEALLYLGEAEAIAGKPCAVWSFVYPNGDRRFRIFTAEEERRAFLASNRRVRPADDSPACVTAGYSIPAEGRFRYVTKKGREEYLSGRGDALKEALR